MPIAVGSAHLATAGESVCGDACVIVDMAQGVLLGVADGLGHGPSAREAADAACAHVRAHVNDPLDILLRGVDRALVGTRGAVVSLMALDPKAGWARFAGVGNVELHTLSRANMAAPNTPGILGRGFRSVRVWEHPLAEGDLLVMTSDGVSIHFDLKTFAHLAPQALADALVARFHKKHDDASCAVARVTPLAALGGSGGVSSPPTSIGGFGGVSAPSARSAMYPHHLPCTSSYLFRLCH